MIKKSFCEASHSHSHVLYYLVIGGASPPVQVHRKYMAVAVALAVAVSGGGAVAVAVAAAGLTKRFFNHIQQDFLINVRV